MHKYARKIFNANFRLWLPSILTISFLSCLVSLCLLHIVWVNSSEFVAQAMVFGLELAEFSIISVTLYSIVLGLAFCSLWMIGKATAQQLKREFAQWRLLGATPRETIKCNLFFSAYISVIGCMCGVLCSCPLSFWILPKFNIMANGYQSYMVFQYQFSFLAIIGAFILSFITCFIASGMTAFLARKVKPLDLFRNSTVEIHKMSKGRKIIGFCLVGYTILLIFMIPIIKQMNGGIVAVYNFMFHIGISAVICVCVFAPQLLLLSKKLLLKLAEIIGARVARISVFSMYYKFETNNAVLFVLLLTYSFLTLMYVGIKTVSIAVFESSGISQLNFSDSFMIALLVAIVAILTSFSIIVLNIKNDSSEIAILKTSGMTNIQTKKLVAYESISFTTTVLLLSIVPVFLASICGSLGLMMTIGIYRSVLDAIPYFIGFVTLFMFLYTSLWLSTRCIVKDRWIESIRQ